LRRILSCLSSIFFEIPICGMFGIRTMSRPGRVKQVVNLAPLLNKDTLEFGFNKLIDIITNMTQEEYDKIIKSARAWRKTIKREFYFDRYNELNQFMIDRIEGIK